MCYVLSAVMLDSRDVYQRWGVLALLTHHGVSFMMAVHQENSLAIRTQTSKQLLSADAGGGAGRDSSLFELD
jgi:hypothetical protein